MSFRSLALPDFLIRAVAGLGYVVPTPVQVAAIPVVASGRDVAAEAQTGSGKTAAFALPVIQRLCAGPLDPSAVSALAVVPTRELALQVAASFIELARLAPQPVRVLAVIGAEPIEEQIIALRAGVHVVVATPGRLLDLLAHGEIHLGQLKTLILDEADKLLDAGFADELGPLLDALPTERQTLLFSATLPPRVLALAERVLRDPVTVRIDEHPVPVASIQQRVFQVDRNKRRALLEHLIKTETWGQTLVFVATQRAAHNLSAKLRKAGLVAGALHGGLEQPERIEVLDRFKRGRIAILVATDLAARGLDIPDLAAVVNFDLPRAAADYIHRIGRTGRAGESGLAVCFVDHDSAAHLALIQRRNGLSLTPEQLPGFELTGEPPQRKKGPPPVKGTRMSKKDKLRERAKGEP